MPAAVATVILKALQFAARKHKTQRRKDVDASPYINHPIAVANVLANEAGITEATTLAAALLHDTIEDTDTTAQELERAFGGEIAAIVMEVTDDKSLPKQRRKQLQGVGQDVRYHDIVCGCLERFSQIEPRDNIVHFRVLATGGDGLCIDVDAVNGIRPQLRGSDSEDAGPATVIEHRRASGEM